MARQEISIESDFITLGQVLKNEGIIATGGQAKWFLLEEKVLVNQEQETRRGRKLYPGDQVTIPALDFDALMVADEA